MERLNTNPVISVIELKVNKNFPNSHLPVLIYRQAVELPLQKNKAATIVQRTFIRNNWGNTWKNGIYSFHHYHSTTHECLGICSGKAAIILGGPNGKRLSVEKGDVIIIPAGVAHKCSKASEDFVCVGAYPQSKDYDILLGKSNELADAKERIAALSIPAKDPLFGSRGFIKSHWK